MRKQINKIIIGVFFLISAGSVNARTYSGLYAFGDSLSDAGTNPSAVISLNKLIGGCDLTHFCPPYFEGHISNGSIAVEQLANSILPGGANPGNFFDFAVAGATSGIGNFGDGGTANNNGVFNLPGISQELSIYAANFGGVADHNALFFLWGGANDFLTGDAPDAAAKRIAAYAMQLIQMGAQKLLIPNLPDLGLTPFVKSSGSLAEAVGHNFSTIFNATLSNELNLLASNVPNNINIFQFDSFGLFNSIYANPTSFGFTNNQDACVVPKDLTVFPPVFDKCSDPAQYIFWDGFHPTTQLHSIFAGEFARTVPEPGIFTLVMLGLVGSALLRLRKIECV